MSILASINGNRNKKLCHIISGPNTPELWLVVFLQPIRSNKWRARAGTAPLPLLNRRGTAPCRTRSPPRKPPPPHNTTNNMIFLLIPWITCDMSLKRLYRRLSYLLFPIVESSHTFRSEESIISAIISTSLPQIAHNIPFHTSFAFLAHKILWKRLLR